jgi:hypothetical protein
MIRKIKRRKTSKSTRKKRVRRTRKYGGNHGKDNHGNDDKYKDCVNLRIEKECDVKSDHYRTCVEKSIDYCDLTFGKHNDSVSSKADYDGQNDGKYTKSDSHESPKSNRYKSPKSDSHESPKSNRHKSPKSDSDESPKSNRHNNHKSNRHKSPKSDSHESPKSDSHESPKSGSHNNHKSNRHESSKSDSHESSKSNRHNNHKSDRHESPSSHESHYVFYSKDDDTDIWYPGVKKDGQIYECETTINMNKDNTNFDIILKETKSNTIISDYKNIIPKNRVPDIKKKVEKITQDQSTHISILYCYFDQQLENEHYVDQHDPNSAINKEGIKKMKNAEKTWVKASIAKNASGNYVIIPKYVTKTHNKPQMIEIIGNDGYDVLSSWNGNSVFEFDEIKLVSHFHHK